MAIEIEQPLLNAATTFPGPVLLLAGPGTGKTFQLAHRVKFLVESLNVDPRDIAVMTFTVAATRNMRERLRSKELDLPSHHHPKIIGTIHSLGNAIVRSAVEQLGLPEDYGVIGDDELRSVLLADAAALNGCQRQSAALTVECRRVGNCSEDPDDEKCQICGTYRSILRKCSCIDHDDQILLACEVLRTDAELRATWQQSTKHLLVDEFQDINKAQCELIQLLSEGQPEGLFAVGDDDQSIYSFRGGSPEFILDFEKLFGGEAKIGRLSKTFRCPTHVLKGARAMLAAFYRGETKPEPEFDEKLASFDNKIVLYNLPTEKWEATKIARIARHEVGTRKVAIIVPSVKHLPPIRRALGKASVNYTFRVKPRKRGLRRFVALAKCLRDKQDNLSLREVVDLVIRNHDKLTERVRTAGSGIKAKREAASNLVARLWNDVSTSASLSDAISEAAKAEASPGFFTGLYSVLEETRLLHEKKGRKRDGMEPFMQACGLLIAPGGSACELLDEVAEWMQEITGSSRSRPHEPVEILTRESAKGLEADVVFVIDVTEGHLPDPEKDREEQSRLFYVAMTRAKQKLYLCHTRSRSGGSTFSKASFQLQISPFVRAIPEEHLETRVQYPRK